LERLHEEVGLSPQLPATASRVSVPIYREGIQVGKATSSTWSPTLKKMIALATLESSACAVGTMLEMELTVDQQRKRVSVTVAKLPFFDPPASGRDPADALRPARAGGLSLLPERGLRAGVSSGLGSGSWRWERGGA
jgi:aminomethyltransferase